MKKKIVACIQVVAVLFIVSNYAIAADWRFPVGFTYVGNFNKIVDLCENNLETELEEEFDIVDVYTEFKWPFGTSFQPYVEFDMGLGVGIGIGPLMYIKSSGFKDVDFFNVPINLNLRYSLIPKKDISPYVRAGVSYNIASGDYVEDSKLGFLGALGVEFSRKSPVGYGLEVGYDSSEIEFEDFRRDGTKNIKPINWWASLFVVF